MATNKAKTESVNFGDLVKRASGSSGIPEKDIKQSFSAVKQEIETVIREKRPAKPGDVLTISCGLNSFRFQRTEEKIIGGKLYPESIRVQGSSPNAFIQIANEGMDVKSRPVEEKAPKKKSA